MSRRRSGIMGLVGLLLGAVLLIGGCGGGGGGSDSGGGTTPVTPPQPLCQELPRPALRFRAP